MPDAIAFRTTAPVLRMFDTAKAKEFYLGFLGFALDWEHRFAPDLPLYFQVSRNGLVLHLSEHHGDGSPGIVVFVAMHGIEAFHAEITARNYGYMRPGIQEVDWGREMTVIDPFVNRIRFCEQQHK